MKEFEVTITETLQKSITVEAATKEEAQAMVEEMWDKGDVVLDADHFVGAEFSCNDGQEIEADKPIEVLLVEPGQYARMTTIGSSLEDMQKVVGGYIQEAPFLGGKEPTTLKELNQTLGKETIDTFNTGESRGREVSHSLNYQKLGKDLATVDELAVLDGGKCILQLRGVRPFLSDKYDITKHPNYKYLSDADKRNEFDIERFLSRRLKPKPDEVYDVYDIDASVMDAGETAGG